MNNGFADRRLCLISSIFLNTYIFIAFLWCDFWCNYFLDFSNLLAAKNGTHIPSAVQSVCVQVSFSSGVPMGAGTYPRPVSQDISGAVGSCFVPCCMNTLWTISITSISRHRLFACRLNNSLPTPGRKPPTHTPTMPSPENVDSGEADGLLRRATRETFSRTYSIVEPIHSLLNQNNACALEHGNNIIRPTIKVKSTRKKSREKIDFV